MKRLLTICLAVTMLLSAAGYAGFTAGAFQAETGWWEEIYAVGGPGSASSFFHATTNTSPLQWSIEGYLVAILSATPGSGFTTYVTKYNGDISLASGAGGASASWSDVDFFITATSYDGGGLSSALEFTGAVGTATITLEGIGSRTVTNEFWHAGTVDSATITVVPEPATMVLLGLGGLLLRRRKA